ncbi:unnamed protein product [Durusdinium trenchii]|uniref:Uncharacterized protein n=1 Tax=Durusdinium trenchii TaxID=1381693 RepID=A0ABP0IZL3_9DINO
MARKLKEYLLAAVVLVFLGSRREAFVSVPSLRTGRGATAPTGRTSPRSVAVRAHWGLGPLGPVESAAAFRIYFLPFVDPLEIDETLIDQLFGGWFGPLTPLLLGLLVFWVQSQINAVRREQEGRVIGSAAKAVGDWGKFQPNNGSSSSFVWLWILQVMPHFYFQVLANWEIWPLLPLKH